jgi:hypothetical protein
VVSAPADDFYFATALAVDGPHVWVAIFNRQYQSPAGMSMTRRNVVTELNSSDGSLVRVISTPSDALHGASAIAASGPDVWVANVNSVTELNASTGSLVRVIDARDGDIDRPVAVAVSGPNVWVANLNSVTELNASTGSLVRNIKTGAGGSDEPLGISVSGPHVWLTDVDPRTSADAVTELSSTDGSIVRMINSPADEFNFNTPAAITSNAADVWVANVNSVTELSSSNGDLVRVIHGPGHELFAPEALTVRGPHLWIENWANGSVAELTTNNELVHVFD